MSLFDRYGIKEVADVTFYELNGTRPGKPVLYLDTLKVSTMEQTAEAAEARGGKGNAALMAWDYGKEVTINLEDALFSTKSLEVMYGKNSLAFDQDTAISRNKYFTIKDQSVPFFVWNPTEEKYQFNAAKAEQFGLPWRTENHTTISNSGTDRVTLKPVGDVKNYVGPNIAYKDAKTLFNTGIPYYVEAQNYSITADFTGAEYTSKVELLLEGTRNVTGNGILGPYSRKTTQHLPLKEVSSVRLVSCKLDGENNSGKVSYDSSQQIVEIEFTGFTPSSGTHTYEYEYEITFKNDSYVGYAEATIMDPYENNVVIVNWSYSYQSGEGGLSIKEAGKTYYGLSSIVINGKYLSLSQPIDTALLQAAGFDITEGESVTLEKGFYLFSVEVDGRLNNSFDGKTIDVSANTFPGVYYVIGDTFVRNEKTGKDEFFQIHIPKAKIVSESNTITMEAEGDPTVFNMSLKVLKSKTEPMVKLVKYRAGQFIPTLMFAASKPTRKDTAATNSAGPAGSHLAMNSGSLGVVTEVCMGTYTGSNGLESPLTIGGAATTLTTNFSGAIVTPTYQGKVNPNRVYFYGGASAGNTSSPEDPDAENKEKQALFIRFLEGYMLSFIYVDALEITQSPFKVMAYIDNSKKNLWITLTLDSDNRLKFDVGVNENWLWTEDFWIFCGLTAMEVLTGIGSKVTLIKSLSDIGANKQYLVNLFLKVNIRYLGEQWDMMVEGIDDPIVIKP